MAELQRILVPVHASRSSRAALFRARLLAEATGAALRLLSVQPLRARAINPFAFDDFAEHRRGRLAEVGDVDAEQRVTVVGEPLSVILAEAARTDVELVVIGHGERGWLARGLVSPLHERVVKHCRVPVVVVHADGPRRPAPSPEQRQRPTLRLVKS